jgi:hypothetical protein
LQDSSALSPGEDASDSVTVTTTVGEINGTSQKDDTPGPESVAKPNLAAASTPTLVTEYDRIQQLARKMSTPKSDTPAAAKTKTTSRPSKSLAAHIKATAGKSDGDGGATADVIIPNSPGPVDSLAERLPADTDVVRAAETGSQTPSGKTVRKPTGKKAALVPSSSGEATSVEVIEESSQDRGGVETGGGARRGLAAAKRPGGESKNRSKRKTGESICCSLYLWVAGL